MAERFLITLLLATAALAQSPPDRTRVTVPLQVDASRNVRITNGIVELARFPTQPSGSDFLCLEAEHYDAINWQPLHDAALSNERIEVVREKMLTRGYFPDRTASGDAHIARASALSYATRFQIPGKYTIWIRLRRPGPGTWAFDQQVDRREPTRVIHEWTGSREWSWQKTGTTRIAQPAGVTLTITNLHDGQAIDKILFHRDPEFKPDGTGPDPTPSKTARLGEIVLRAVRPAAARHWGEVRFDPPPPSGVVPGVGPGVGRDTSRDPDRFTIEYSVDRAGTWQSLPAGGRLGRAPATLLLRLTLRAARAGESLSVPLPTLTAIASPGRWHVISDGTHDYLFNRRDGSLTGIQARLGATGSTTTVIPPGTSMDMFRLGVRPDHTPPARIKWLEFKDFALTDRALSGDHATFSYRSNRLPIFVEVTYRLNPGGYLDAGITVRNDHEHDVLRVEFPRLNGVRIGDSPADDRLIWPHGTGRIIRKPYKRKHTALYPRAAVGFVDLYDSNAGFYLATHDHQLVSTVLKATPNRRRNALNFTITKRDRVGGRGGEAHFPLAFGIHRGTWHHGADWYRQWFYAHFQNAPRPDWLAESDGWLMANPTFTKVNYAHLPEFVFRQAIRLGFRHVQMWGTTLNHPCPTYYYPPHFAGGPDAFARGNGWWKQRGGVVGYYIQGNKVNTYAFHPDHPLYFKTLWSDIPAYGRPPGWDTGASWKWIEENAHYGPNRKKPAIPVGKWRKKKRWPVVYPISHLTMSPYSLVFQDWLKFWVVDKFVGDFNCGAVYLDTFHINAERPEFNLYLKMHGQGRGGHLRHLFAKRLWAEGRRLNPDWLPVMEMQCDAYGVYLAYMIGGSAKDSEMLRYTHPEHVTFEGQSGGGWGRKRFKRFNSAWMYGSRLDHRGLEAWTVEVIRMRNWITRWINGSRFLDDLGLTIEQPGEPGDGRRPEIRGKLHRVMTANGTRGFLATFWNTRRREAFPDNPVLKRRAEWRDANVSIDLGPMAEVDHTVTRPEDWIPKRAFLIDLNRIPRPIDFEVVGTTVKFQLPPRQVNGVLFVVEARGEHALLVRTDQQDFRQMDVHLINAGNEPLDLAVRARAETFDFVKPGESLTLGPGRYGRVTLPYPGDRPPATTELVLVEVEADGTTRTIRTGAYPFLDDASFEIDQIGKYSERHKTDGLRSRVLRNTSRLEFRLEPDRKYRMTFNLRPPTTMTRTYVRFGHIERKDSRIGGIQLRFRHRVRFRKHGWTPVKMTFSTPEMYHDGWLRIEMRRGQRVLIDDVRLETLDDQVPVRYKPAYHKGY